MNDNNLNQENQNNFYGTTTNNVQNQMDMNNPQPQMNINQQQSMYNPQPQMNMNGSMNQPPVQGKKDNKKMLIIGGVILALVAIIIVLLFTVFKKDNDISKDYDDYLKEQEKEYEKLNENYTLKDYKIADGILVILENKNDKVVNVNLKIEFFDESGALINVENGYMSYVPSKSKSYANFYVQRDMKYASYKVSAKLESSHITTTYNDKVKIVSTNKNDDELLIQVKNESDKKLQVEVGVLFYAAGDTIVGYENEYFYDVNASETTSGKVYVPYDSNYNLVNYERTEVVVVTSIYK